MNRIVLLAGVLSLTGCVVSHPTPKQFDLGEFTPPKKPGRVLAANLIIPDVTQPSWIRTRDIVYRLEYESTDRPQRYVLNQWVATPAEMVTLRLRQIIQSANRGFTVSAPNGVAGNVLQANIDEFAQSFSTPKDSRCVLRLRVTLWRADGRIDAQRVFELEMPAPTPDASGAARCLATAVDREGDQLVDWLAAALTPAP
jgi:cholesterol transport system auxiliary component